jgi:hypothetical protein
VAQEDDVGRADLLFPADEAAADDRLDAEEIEEVVRDDAGLDALRLTASVELERHRVVLADAGERREFPIVVDLRHRQAPLRVVGVRLPDADESLVRRIRQLLQQRAIDHAEDRGRRADAEGDGDDRQRGEGRRLREGPRGESDVAEDVGEHWERSV